MMIYIFLSVLVIIAVLIFILCLTIDIIDDMHDEYLDCDDTFREDDV